MKLSSMSAQVSARAQTPVPKARSTMRTLAQISCVRFKIAACPSVTHASSQNPLMVVDSVVAANSKCNHAKALDHLFISLAGRLITRANLMKWQASMETLSPSTVKVPLSAARQLIAEARANGMIGMEEAENLSGVQNIREESRLEAG